MPNPPVNQRPSLVKNVAAALAVLCLLAAGTGCAFFRNYGTGVRLDKTQSHRPAADNRVRTMVIVVTTDAQGQVADISFQRSSGKQGIDGYVVESIRQGWPAQPSQRTVAEITYSHEKGFSQPKVLSSGPA